MFEIKIIIVIVVWVYILSGSNFDCLIAKSSFGHSTRVIYAKLGRFAYVERNP